MNKEELDHNNVDTLASIIRATTGLVPLVGPIMGELLEHSIPNQRIDRITKFVKLLEFKLKNISSEIIEEIKTNEDFIDIVTDAFQQSVKARSDERREYLSSLVCKGLENKEIIYDETKTVLTIIDQLSDTEIIWLRSYMSRGGFDSYSDPFYIKHEHILAPVPISFGSDESDRMKDALQKACQNHLQNLSLIEYRIRVDRNTNAPIYDSSGNPEYSGVTITHLGKMVLSYIGFESEIDQSNALF